MTASSHHTYHTTVNGRVEEADKMWNPIVDGDGVFEMRLRNRNGRKSVSEIHPMGLNTIWRFPHVSRLIGRDITDTVEVWLVDVGGLQWSLSDTSIVIISALPSDYMIGTEDELTDEFDEIYVRDGRDR